jgi:hypothetical protein
MALGLALDTRSIPGAVLATLCSTGSGWHETWRLHWLAMPATNAGMLLGAVVPLAMQTGRAARAGAATLAGAILADTGRLTAMSLGMACAGRLGADHAARAGESGFIGLCIGMALGMGLPMLVGQGLRSKSWPSARCKSSFNALKLELLRRDVRHADETPWAVFRSFLRVLKHRNSSLPDSSGDQPTETSQLLLWDDP